MRVRFQLKLAPSPLELTKSHKKEQLVFTAGIGFRSNNDLAQEQFNSPAKSRTHRPHFLDHPVTNPAAIARRSRFVLHSDKGNTGLRKRLYSLSNLSHDGASGFDYDSANWRAQARIRQGGEAFKIAYLHNALGQRVFKSEA